MNIVRGVTMGLVLAGMADESYSSLAGAPLVLTGMSTQFLQPPRT
jgi:hypothetical protein